VNEEECDYVNGPLREVDVVKDGEDEMVINAVEGFSGVEKKDIVVSTLSDGVVEARVEVVYVGMA
jgi:hypothetical protein